MKKKIFYLLILVVTLFFNSCKKDSINDATLELTQLGTTNFKPSAWGIRGFNQTGAPIIHNDLNYLYEWNEAANTFNKIGDVIPNAVGVANSRVAQDALGDYYFHSGYQGEIFILNKTTNHWDSVSIAPGPKNRMMVNKKGDIVVHIDNTPYGGVQSFYKKTSNSKNWVKVIEMAIGFTEVLGPQFLNNDGIVFFNKDLATNQVDGSGRINDVILNTNTGDFGILYDKSDPINFTATNNVTYADFTSYYTSPDGVFYVVVNGSNQATIYSIDSREALPAKFKKVQDLDIPPFSNDTYQLLRQFKLNESTGEVRVGTTCPQGLSSHKNIGVAKLGGSTVKILDHDGPQRSLISSPNGTVFVHNFDGYLFKWE